MIYHYIRSSDTMTLPLISELPMWIHVDQLSHVFKMVQSYFMTHKSKVIRYINKLWLVSTTSPTLTYISSNQESLLQDNRSWQLESLPVQIYCSLLGGGVWKNSRTSTCFRFDLHRLVIVLLSNSNNYYWEYISAIILIIKMINLFSSIGVSKNDKTSWIRVL